MIKPPIYEKGIQGLKERQFLRERPFAHGLHILPDPAVDLDQVRRRTVPKIAVPRHRTSVDLERKHAQISQGFVGQSELFVLHGVTNAVLRRRDPPAKAREIFMRMWSEQGDFLLSGLPVRWKVSAAVTFAAHGCSADERCAATGISMVYDMIKLHDSERRLTGKKSHVPHRPFRRFRKKDDLAFGLKPYAADIGDLDRNILTRLHDLCEASGHFRQLGLDLLDLVLTDRRTIFARLQNNRHYIRRLRQYGLALAK